MSIKSLSENTRVTVSLAVSTVVGALSVGIYVGRLSQRVTDHDGRIAGVEQKQEKTDDWAATTAQVLAKLEAQSELLLNRAETKAR